MPKRIVREDSGFRAGVGTLPRLGEAQLYWEAARRSVVRVFCFLSAASRRVSTQGVVGADARPQLGAQAVEDLVERGLEDRRPDGRLELARVVELTEEPVDVELVDGPAQQRRGREQVVDEPVRDRADDRLDDPGQIGLVERFGKQLGHLGQAALAVEPVHGVARGPP